MLIFYWEEKRMTKSEFMIELKALLSKIPEEERNDAINYYEDYFADAGILDDGLVPASIGSPKQVADKIIDEAVYEKSPKQEEEEIKENDNSKLILGIVLVLVTSPIWFSILVGIGGLLFGILAGVGGVIVGFGVAGIALIVTAFLSGTLAGGMMLVGVGILLLALALVMIIPLVLYCGKFLPWGVKEIVKLFKRLLGRKE